MHKAVRNQGIDAMRGVAMVLVVYGHALEMFSTGTGAGHAAFETWRMIFAFHMPAFYFVSGLVAANLKAKPFVKALAAALSLILFAAITHLLVAPLQAAALYHQGNSAQVIATQILKPLLLGQGFNLVVTWFLVSLAFVQILAWIYLQARPWGRLAIWLCLAGLYFVFQVSDYQLFQFSTWGAGLVFFLLGHAVARSGWLEDGASWMGLSERLGYFLIACLAAASVFVLYPLNQGCALVLDAICRPYRGRYPFAVLFAEGHLGFLPLFFLTAVLGILAVAALAKAAQGGVWGLTWIGRNTLALLILNGLVLAFVQHRLAKLFPVSNMAMAALAWAAVATLVQLFALPLIRPVLDRLYAVCRSFSETVVKNLFLPQMIGKTDHR
jgi:fucose 4-O-acetylase-like acetyltransferase